MSAMTKERAAQIAAGGGFNFDEIAVLARIAQASLEAEPIGFAFADDVDLMRKKIKVGGMLTVRNQGEVALYSAPPAPVVPEEMPKGLAGQIVSLLAHNIGDKFLAQKIWNACRAAMLQGAEPVSNRDELTDAVNGLLAVMDEYPESLVPINRDSAVVRQLRAAAAPQQE